MSEPDITEMLNKAKIKDRDILLAVALHFIFTKKLEKEFLAYLDKLQKKEK